MNIDRETVVIINDCDDRSDNSHGWRSRTWNDEAFLHAMTEGKGKKFFVFEWDNFLRIAVFFTLESTIFERLGLKEGGTDKESRLPALAPSFSGCS